MIISNKSLKCELYEDNSIITREDFEFEYSGCRFTIKSGFQFDGATIPRIALRVCKGPREQKNLIASLIHDYLYATKPFDRQLSDQIFYETLLEMGKNKIISYIMYKSVRIFGAKHY